MEPKVLTKEDIEIAKSIIEDLYIPHDYGCDDDGCEPDFNSIYDQIPATYGSFSIKSGISKLVIVFDELPFVIKTPFYGMWEENGSYNEETDEYESDYQFYEFEGALQSNDYCNAELCAIEDMIENDFACFAPETICLGCVNNRDFYIQEKVKCYSSVPHAEPSAASKAIIESMDNGETYRHIADKDWIGLVIDYYGIEKWRDFVDWALAYDSVDILGDMYGRNYGFHMDGAPVILDLSGFNS